MTVGRAFFFYFIFLIFSEAALAQVDFTTTPSHGRTPAQLEVDQVRDILGLTEGVRKLRMLQSQNGCGAHAATLEEVTLRQDLLESVQIASLDVDAAMAMIANERGKLSNLQTSLKASRDKTVARLNAAALITGSGVGAAVSATQFTAVGSRTNNVGDGVGVGSGAASTLLAYLAVRKQHGPQGVVGEVSNMLAPLFDRPPALDTHYPEITWQYLQSVPPGESAERGTRLEQLKAEWRGSGRLDSLDSAKEQKKITVLTASGEDGIKISIDELTDRIAMLGDVSGRIALMKRNLAMIMLSYRAEPAACAGH